MVTLFAAAADAAPINLFMRQGPDWEMILLLSVIGGVAVFIAIMTAWLLHRFKGDSSLHLRSLVAGAFPVLLYAALIIGLLVALEGRKVDEAVERFFEMRAEGWVVFLGCFIGSWVTAFALGWWLRRRVAKSSRIDPSVFG